MGKMILLQNIGIGTSVTGMTGNEGEVSARLFKHRILLALLVGFLVLTQQYVSRWMIPAH